MKRGRGWSDPPAMLLPLLATLPLALGLLGGLLPSSPIRMAAKKIAHLPNSAVIRPSLQRNGNSPQVIKRILSGEDDDYENDSSKLDYTYEYSYHSLPSDHPFVQLNKDAVPQMIPGGGGHQPSAQYKPKYPAHPWFGLCSLDDFDFPDDERLGRGGFGKVYLAVHRATKITVAMKEVSAESIDKNPKHVELEETIHHGLIHPYITRHYCTMKDDHNHVYFAMEYIPGKNLAKRLGEIFPLAKERLQRMVAEMIVALEYLHSQCILYRDIKAENVLVDPEGHIKFIDFGLSVWDCDNRMNNLAGTLEYTAPEMAARKRYGRATDWYSLGILTYVLFLGKLPMTRRQFGGDKEAFLRKIVEGLPLESTGDADADDLIRKLTDKNPKTRWGMSPESRAQLRQHPFFRGLDWGKIMDPVQKVVQFPSIPKAAVVDDGPDSL